MDSIVPLVVPWLKHFQYSVYIAIFVKKYSLVGPQKTGGRVMDRNLW